MRVSDLVISYLESLNIREVFVVYGAANGDLIDSFIGKKRIKYIACMHEQAAGFAAEGYAKISENFGVAIATSGPGGGNLVTPIQNCFYDSVPCLFITGQINSQFLRKDSSLRQVGFQETDIVGTVRGITKYAVMITDPTRARYELEKAIFIMKEGRPGPVLLDIPIDVQKKEVTVSQLEGFDYGLRLGQCILDGDKLDLNVCDYLSDLCCSKRPAILIGGGIRTSRAVSELLKVGDLLKIPIFPTWNALDVVTSDYEYYGGRIGTYGGPGRNFGIQNSDLLLCVGTRISGRITGGNVKTFARAAKKYLVDVDSALLETKNQQVPCDVNIFCDARIFLECLAESIRSKNIPDFSSWMNQVILWREKYDPVKSEYYEREDIVDPYVFFRTLSEEMHSEDILVGDCGGNIVISNHAFKTKRGQRNITNNGNSPMGFSFAAAMGAWFASDKRQNVVCTIGDGGFTMNIQEIQTFLNYGIKVKTFIIDNRVYGITKAFHEFNFKRSIDACGGPTGYVPPDFVKVCHGFGMKTFEINFNREIVSVVRDVLNYDGPAVCVVRCPNHYNYEPKMVGWKNPIEDMYPFLPRDEFRKNMLIDPVEDWEKNV